MRELIANIRNILHTMDLEFEAYRNDREELRNELLEELEKLEDVEID